VEVFLEAAQLEELEAAFSGVQQPQQRQKQRVAVSSVQLLLPRLLQEEDYLALVQPQLVGDFLVEHQHKAQGYSVQNRLQPPLYSVKLSPKLRLSSSR